MANSLAVAQAFLDLAKAEGKQLTNMHLQKLVFFAHGVHLAAFDGEPLIADEVKAWDFGPVIPPLYNRLSMFGKQAIPPNVLYCGGDSLSPNANKAIKTVWEAYKSYSGWQLSMISHNKESPWDTVWNEQGERYGVIPDELIQAYYEKRVKKRA